MPPLPVVPGVVKMVAAGHNSDANFLNIYHVQYSGGPPNVSDLTSFHGDILTQIEYIYIHNGSADLSLDSVEYTDLASNVGATTTIAVGTAGTVTGNVLPMSASVVVSHEILRRYRGGHPRTYLPLGTANTLEGSSTKDWQTSFLTNTQNDFEAFRTATAAGVHGSVNWLGLCNVSYIDGGIQRVTPVVDLVIGSVARPRICSQRRRLGKVGG
jgi:hypothetical protein